MRERHDGSVRSGKGDASHWMDRRKAFLWTTTAARNRPDPWVVEIMCDVGLRAAYGLRDGDVVTFELPVESSEDASR